MQNKSCGDDLWTLQSTDVQSEVGGVKIGMHRKGQE